MSLSRNTPLCCMQKWMVTSIQILHRFQMDFRHDCASGPSALCGSVFPVNSGSAALCCYGCFALKTLPGKWLCHDSHNFNTSANDYLKGMSYSSHWHLEHLRSMIIQPTVLSVHCLSFKQRLYLVRFGRAVWIMASSHRKCISSNTSKVNKIFLSLRIYSKY